MSKSQRTGVISLLFKKNYPLQLKNYRPIPLLNIDTCTKFLARALSKRLKNILPKIIHTDWKGFVKNCYIGLNIRKIQNIIDYSEKYNIDGATMYLYFSKEFDCLEWIFMTESFKMILLNG